MSLYRIFTAALVLAVSSVHAESLAENIKSGKIKLSSKEFSFPGTVQKSNDFEILIFSKTGPSKRSPEALVITQVKPSVIEALLKGIGLKKGDLINIDLEVNLGSKKKRIPVEDFIIDPRTKRTMTRKGFYYHGAKITQRENLADTAGNICLIDPKSSPGVSDSVILLKEPAKEFYSLNNNANRYDGKKVRVIISARKVR